MNSTSITITHLCASLQFTRRGKKQRKEEKNEKGKNKERNIERGNNREKCKERLKNGKRLDKERWEKISSLNMIAALQRQSSISNKDLTQKLVEDLPHGQRCFLKLYLLNNAGTLLGTAAGQYAWKDKTSIMALKAE